MSRLRDAHREDHRSLMLQLHREAEAKARYAFDTELAVPPGVVHALAPSEQPQATADDAAPQTVPAKPDLRRLVMPLEQLSCLVAPATPRSIVFLAEEAQKPAMRWLPGSITVVPHMMLVVLLAHPSDV